jgi:glycosyltransferase involved in cell wall biosynthesis
LFITLGKLTHNEENTIEDSKGIRYNLFQVKNQTFSKEEIKQEITSYTWTEIYPRLKKFSPEIVHVHTLSTFFNITHLEKCRNFYTKVTLTTHIPGHFCPTGEMIKYGTSPCNGLLSFQCDLCLIKSNWRDTFTAFYRNKRLIKSNLIGKLKDLEIQIICVSDWQIDQLIKNGYPKKNIFKIRQIFVPNEDANTDDSLIKNPNKKITIGYLGRLSKEKGTDLLIDVIQKYKNDNSIIFKLGIPKNINNVEFDKLEKIASQFSNLEIDHGVNEKTKSAFFSKIDLLLIPSFILETGPIVLLEGVYYKKSILAPNVGGPLEFSVEFPNNVICYDWNNLKSVISKIESYRRQTAESF